MKYYHTPQPDADMIELSADEFATLCKDLNPSAADTPWQVRAYTMSDEPFISLEPSEPNTDWREQWKDHLNSKMEKFAEAIDNVTDSGVDQFDVHAFAGAWHRCYGDDGCNQLQGALQMVVSTAQSNRPMAGNDLSELLARMAAE